MSTLCKAALVGVAASLLGACGSIQHTYQVTVLNQSDTTITANMRKGEPLSDSVVLRSDVVAPGSQATLGPVDTPLEWWVELEVAGGGFRTPPKKLEAGHTFISVESHEDRFKMRQTGFERLDD